MRLSRFPATVVAALFMLGWISLSQADPIISDDFESYSLGHMAIYLDTSLECVGKYS